MSEESLGVRVQRMPMTDRTLVLASIASARSADATLTGAALMQLFYAAALPPPAKVGNVLAALKTAGLVTPGKARGAYLLTPLGRQRVSGLVGDDSTALLAEALPGGAQLGHSTHPLIPASLAPPALLGPVGEFTKNSPSATNVFGMTRFPDADEEPDGPDPVAAALAAADEAVKPHGLRFLLAAQRALVDDLWGNVAAHMWASNYGLAFFEDRRGRGMNYNLVIEVGAMLMAGRRCLLLKDKSLKKMPTDLVGFIYKSVDLDDPSSVTIAVHEWVREDLAFGNCAACPGA